MTTPYSRVPPIFPRIEVAETNTRRILKASLIRRIAEAQNFLWARGRVWGAFGYEGNGCQAVNGDDSREYEYLPDGSGILGLCVCTFLVPQNWNKKNTVKISYRSYVSASGTMDVFARLEDLRGNLITYASTAVPGTGFQDSSFTIDTPVTGDYQIRILLSFGYGGIGGASVAPSGTYSGLLTHVSARYEEADDVDDTWFELPTDFFSNQMSVASVFLQKLVRNTLHLWGMRTPELCQSYIGPEYCNDSTFAEVGRYVVWIPDRIDKLYGQLVVYCTDGGAGNEVRVLVNGTVYQTWTALSVGLQTLAFDLFALLDIDTYGGPNAEYTITIEAKSTVAAFSDWGTIVRGVQIIEANTNILDVPADYVPLDFNAIEGDDVITAQDLNSYGQVAGLRHLFNNDKWLAGKRLRVLVGDWRHRCYKHAIEFGGGDPDPRLDWTRGWGAAGRPRNMTVDASHIVPSVRNNDAQTPFPWGLADTVNGYTTAPFIYPAEITYNDPGAGGRLLFLTMMQAFSSVEARPRWQLRARVRRARPYQGSNDVNGTGPASADEFYVNQIRLTVSDGTGVIDVRCNNAPNGEDWKPYWAPVVISANNLGDIEVTGTLIGTEGVVTDGSSLLTRIEGVMFEVELCSVHLADIPLVDEDLKELF